MWCCLPECISCPYSYGWGPCSPHPDTTWTGGSRSFFKSYRSSLGGQTHWTYRKGVPFFAPSLTDTYHRCFRDRLRYPLELSADARSMVSGLPKATYKCPGVESHQTSLHSFPAFSVEQHSTNLDGQHVHDAICRQTRRCLIIPSLPLYRAALEVGSLITLLVVHVPGSLTT